MEMVFKYPLTPVPLSLANLNGTMNHTDKAKLLHKLEERIESDEPRAIDITVVDASFFMHTIQSAPQSYGKLAELLLQRLCSMSQRIDFVCDTYISPSLKDTERRRRSGTETTFKITGPDQRCPRDLNQALKSSSFKTEFVHFLADEWTKEPYAAILVGHKLYLALESVCYKYEVINAAIVRDEMPTYASQHEEADTRMIFHLANIFEESPDVNVVVRSNDTDVLILLVYHVKQIRNNPKVWMDLGVASNNTRRYINISYLVSTLSPSIVDALPGLHAFTGCDVTAAFLGKGKCRPLQLMEKTSAHAETFAQLGKEKNLSQNVQSGLEFFVCCLYGKPNLKHICELHVLFNKIY